MSCQSEKENDPVCPPEKIIEIPVGFPPVEFPKDNSFSEHRWQLGKKLFFDPMLSRDNSISCASCHLPEKGFSDTLATSKGVGGIDGTRNSPTLANVAYHPYFTREGGVATLEMQVLVPIQEHNEFDFNILLIVERMKKSAEYTALSQKAYNRQPDAFVLTRAIATYERALLSGNSRYDQFVQGRITQPYTDSERKGKDLFFSDQTQCSKCHGGFNFTNYAFENNGLYQHYNDPGRYRLTKDKNDSARFKVPTLRNIAVTAPYMHDGSLKTLESVVEHYNSGGKSHVQKSTLIQPLGLTPGEKANLVAFLKTLTDESFLNNPKFRQ